MLYFYLSYARGDDDKYVLQFFDDLCTEIRILAGLSPDNEVGFLDVRSLQVGERWSDEVAHSLARSQAFLALCSPRYFRSEPCGREWELFDRRLREFGDKGRPAALLPIIWVPASDVPPAARRVQWINDEGHQGVRQLLRLVQNHDDYARFVTLLAHAIVERAERIPLPPGRDRDLDSVPSAFHSSPAVSSGFDTMQDAVSVVRAAFESAGRRLERGAVPNLLTPGPVWISTNDQSDAEEVRKFAKLVRRGRVGYFVYTGELGSADGVLDRLRLGGTPVISVPLRGLRAALADDRAAGYLRDLERVYGTRDNLFDTKNALTDHRFLFGRDAMLNTVGSALQRDEHVLITGLRKVGKTSLLNVLRQYLVDQPVCMVDLQRFDRHHEDWPSTLFRLMVEAFDRWGAAEREAWPFRPSAPASVTDLEVELHRRIDHLGTPTRLVVILDELERVFPGADETEATRRWVRASGALRVLAQGDRRSVVLIGADLRPVANHENRLGPAGTNPLFSFFQEMPLRLLDRVALVDMVRTLGREMGVDKVEPDFATELFDLSGGHPSLARTLAAEAYRQRRELDRLAVGDLHSGLDLLEDGGQIGFFLHNNLWQMMTVSEREVLSDLAGTGRRRPVSPRWELDQARAGLTAQGLVDVGRIRISLLASWLRENPGVG